MSDRHQVIIVGGGAGGLELATRLGDRLGRKGRAAVTLVDRNETHLWKPLLHEVAAGSMDIHAHQLDYLAQARWHHFSFRCGALEGLDRARHEITVAPTMDERGEEVIPRLINACIQANYRPKGSAPAQLRVVIVGGGATGVELAAELHNTTRMFAEYGLENIDPERFLDVTLIDAGPRILPMLPERIAMAVTETLQGLGVRVVGSEQAVEVAASEVKTKSGKSFPADIAVWAAGIKGADILNDIDGLETNRLNQLVILPTLQTTRDPDIFALGDCSVLPREGRMPPVPPAAQAAHQQASHMVDTIERRLRGEPPRPFRYRDFGSLVSLGQHSTIGSLMGFLSGKSYRVEGWFARLMYLSLYRMHLYALYGPLGVALDTLARLLKRGTEPRVKLH